MSTVIDFYGPHSEATYDCLAQNAQGIARYLTNSPRDPRQLTPDEVRWAHAAGLEIHVVYEMSPTYAGYFTFDQGAADCHNAMARLDELGAPDGTVCYFAVDAPPSTIPVSVLDEYFNGVASVQTSRIVPGIYGFQAHIDYARTRFPEVGKHTWQTYGTPNGPLDLWQHLQEVRCGVEVDVNECSASGWKAQEEDDMDGETVKNLIREMLGSEEGANLVKQEILRAPNGYGVALQSFLDATYVRKDGK